MPTAVSASATNSRKPIERSLSNPVPRKRRAVKRRGRAKDEFESDDEIEREVRTDSESDDDHSSIDSESDSESSSDDLHADAHSEVVTPSTTQSPPPVAREGLPRGPAKDPAASHTALFSDTTNWAEMVADEATNGASSLPVIDFADMDAARLESTAPPPAPAPRARKSNKSGKKAAARSTSAPPRPDPVPTSEAAVSEEPDAREEEPSASTSREPESSQSALPGRSRMQSARQAYQQRLEQDPSFVPKVGEFWGHDDRLLDKEFRSLSGWWRGRWQSRGRGRGGFSLRGRGRGGFFPPRGSGYEQEDGEGATEPPAEEVPPVDRQWTHDGFEEMKKRDERRRTIQEKQQPPPHAAPARGFGFRGRGFVPGRGRGGFGRSDAISPPTSQRPLSSASMGERVWYAQKPERMWTKQNDIFLYNDAATKPRPGVGTGVRVKLPGSKDSSIVRLPPRNHTHPSNKHEPASSAQDEGEKAFTVRLPPRAGKEKAVEESPAVEPVATEVVTTTVEELSIEEIFTVRPHVVANRRVDFFVPSTSASEDWRHRPVVPEAPSPIQPSASSSGATAEASRNAIEDILSTTSVAGGRTSPSPQIQETILRNPPTSEEEPIGAVPAPVEEPQPQRPIPPVLHPLQTSFSPVPPTSPPYGSPYGYAPALPPGVAVNHQGMAYEYATGRPVYIQPTPPPMFTPRPMMHGHHPSLGVPFVPSHLRHHSSASPDYLAHPHPPHTPPVASFVDPATGVPIFAPARQTSRIEIRAPTDASDGKKSRPSHQRSGLSTSSISAADAPQQQPSYFQPQPSYGSEQASAEQVDTSQQPVEYSQAPPMDPSAAYAPYPQPYYYPEQYGYAPYVDMSQQVMHYDMYPPEHHPSHSQPVVYY